MSIVQLPEVIPRLASQARSLWRLCLLVCALSFCGSLSAQSTPVFAVDGIALRGYDAVAYFDGQPAVGRDDFIHQWNGATWKFSSAEHLRRFTADPSRYAPQFGGFCALGMAHGGAVPTDPTAFSVHRGKLYLNASLAIRETWAYDPDWMIGRAEPRWETIRTAPQNRTDRPPPQREDTDVTTPKAPLALGGFDPVSYFDSPAPMAGREEIVLIWDQRTWRFASKRHRAMFRKAPGKYAPQYDGFSALIVAHGGLVPGDPAQYSIVDGRLFLEIGPGPKDTWRRNAPRLIERSDREWPEISSTR